MLNSKRLIFIGTLCSFCIACGSGNSSTGTAQSLSNEPVTYGLRVTTEEWNNHPSLPPEVNVQAFKFNESKTPHSLYQSAMQNLSTKKDVCDLSYDEHVELGELYSAPFDIGKIEEIGAGEIKTVHADGNTHAEFQDYTTLYGIAGSYGYEEKHQGGAIFPDDLSLDVTGAEFPATFSELPNLPDINMVQNGILHGGDTIKWDAFRNANAPLWVYMGTDDGQVTYGTTCITADDGEFTIPETIERVDALTLIRTYVDVRQIDDVVVLTRRTRRWSL